ncbi:MAG: hypothetical protein ACRCX4_05485 [Bacteroidales bacterium]
MKSKVLVILSFFLFSVFCVNAQMTAARKIPPAIIMNVMLNQPADSIWNYISEPENFNDYMGFKDVKCYEGKVLDANVYITFEDGKEREQIISVLKENDKQINFFVQKSHYLDNKWGYAFNVYPRGKNKSNFEMKLYVAESEKERFSMKDMENEFKMIIQNLKSKFNN